MDFLYLKLAEFSQLQNLSKTEAVNFIIYLYLLYLYFHLLTQFTEFSTCYLVNHA